MSGNKSTRPVWFVLEGRTLYLLPVQGSDSEWYKNVLKHPTVTLAAEEAKWTGKAAPIIGSRQGARRGRKLPHQVRGR